MKRFVPAGDDGRRLLGLMLDTRSWMHRRVDRINLEDGIRTRLSVSYDFTLPIQMAVRESEARVVVPITLLKRTTLWCVDTGSVEGQASNILTTSDTRIYTRLLLEATAAFRMSKRQRQDLSAIIDRFLRSTDPEASIALASKEISELLPNNDAQLELLYGALDLFSENFLLLASLPSSIVGRRTSFKYSYDIETPADPKGTFTTKVKQELVGLGDHPSRHFEIHIPPSLDFQKFQVEAKPIQGEQQPQIALAGGVAHAHMLTSPLHESATWTLELRPRRLGLYGFAIFANPLIFLLLLFPSILRWIHRSDILWSPSSLPSTAASILLVGPALLLSWVSREREHAIVAQTLEPLRYMLALDSLSLITLALTVALPLQKGFVDLGWWIAFTLSAVSFLWLVTYRLNWRLLRIFRRMIFPETRNVVHSNL